MEQNIVNNQDIAAQQSNNGKFDKQDTEQQVLNEQLQTQISERAGQTQNKVDTFQNTTTSSCSPNTYLGSQKRDKSITLYSFLKPGTQVEIAGLDEEGFHCTWSPVLVVSLSDGLKLSSRVCIQYRDFLDENGIPLQEELKIGCKRFRPVPPRGHQRSVLDFNLCQHVDVYDNDLWWQGVVTEKDPIKGIHITYPECETDGSMWITNLENIREGMCWNMNRLEWQPRGDVCGPGVLKAAFQLLEEETKDRLFNNNKGNNGKTQNSNRYSSMGQGCQSKQKDMARKSISGRPLINSSGKVQKINGDVNFSKDKTQDFKGKELHVYNVNQNLKADLFKASSTENVQRKLQQQNNANLNSDAHSNRKIKKMISINEGKSKQPQSMDQQDVTKNQNFRQHKPANSSSIYQVERIPQEPQSEKGKRKYTKQLKQNQNQVNQSQNNKPKGRQTMNSLYADVLSLDFLKKHGLIESGNNNSKGSSDQKVDDQKIQSHYELQTTQDPGVNDVPSHISPPQVGLYEQDLIQSKGQNQQQMQAQVLLKEQNITNKQVLNQLNDNKDNQQKRQIAKAEVKDSVNNWHAYNENIVMNDNYDSQNSSDKKCINVQGQQNMKIQKGFLNNSKGLDSINKQQKSQHNNIGKEFNNTDNNNPQIDNDTLKKPQKQMPKINKQSKGIKRQASIQDNDYMPDKINGQETFTHTKKKKKINTCTNNYNNKKANDKQQNSEVDNKSQKISLSQSDKEQQNNNMVQQDDNNDNQEQNDTVQNCQYGGCNVYSTPEAYFIVVEMPGTECSEIHAYVVQDGLAMLSFHRTNLLQKLQNLKCTKSSIIFESIPGLAVKNDIELNIKEPRHADSLKILLPIQQNGQIAPMEGQDCLKAEISNGIYILTIKKEQSNKQYESKGLQRQQTKMTQIETMVQDNIKESQLPKQYASREAARKLFENTPTHKSQQARTQVLAS